MADKLKLEAEAGEIAAPFKELSEHIGDTPVAPAHGVAAIALSMAMKYHDIAVIKDGAMYQQYKLEGRNMQTLHLDMVLETATKLEKWLLGASERIAKVIIDSVTIAVEEDEKKEKEGPAT